MDKIKLQSSDGKIIEADIEVVKCSQLIKKLLEDCESISDSNSSTAIVPLTNVDSEILTKILVWAEYHKDDGETDDVFEIIHDICPWDKQFLKLDQDVLFKIILAANYLDIKDLMRAACRTVADMIANKTPDQIRATFGIRNDFPYDGEENM